MIEEKWFQECSSLSLRRSELNEQLGDIGLVRFTADFDEEPSGLLVDIANIDAALVVEQDDVAVAFRIDAHISLFFLPNRQRQSAIRGTSQLGRRQLSSVSLYALPTVRFI